MFKFKTNFFIVFSFILFSTLACSIQGNTAEPDKAEVATSVAATMAAQTPPTQTVEPSPHPEISPTAASAVTPTTIPMANRHPAELHVGFISPDRDVYTWSQSQGTVKILDHGDASDLKISEDGSLIAVVRTSVDQQSSLWVVGFDGSNPLEMISWAELSGLKTVPDSIGADPNNLQWIPGSHLLTFSTREVFDGPGMVLNDDLIVVDAENGDWNRRLEPGTAGLVNFSPDGLWMAVSTAEEVSIMDMEGNPSPAGVLQFPPVITYSEYRLYPTPQWSSDSSRLAVVIPAEDPLAEPRQPASVWTMEVAGGEPVLQSQVIPQFIGPVSVSPDLTKIFYVKEVGESQQNKREIRTASINGQNDRFVFSGGIPITWDWNPNSEVFTFQTDNTSPITVSQMNGSVGDLADTRNLEWFKWVDAQSFLFVRKINGNEELMIGKWGGGSISIATLPKSEMFRTQVDFTR
jgi:hypothetical protein